MFDQFDDIEPELEVFMAGLDRRLHPGAVANQLILEGFRHLLRHEHRGPQAAMEDFMLIIQKIGADAEAICGTLVPAGTTIH